MKRSLVAILCSLGLLAVCLSIATDLLLHFMVARALEKGGQRSFQVESLSLALFQQRVLARNLIVADIKSGLPILKVADLSVEFVWTELFSNPLRLKAVTADQVTVYLRNPLTGLKEKAGSTLFQVLPAPLENPVADTTPRKVLIGALKCGNSQVQLAQAKPIQVPDLSLAEVQFGGRRSEMGLHLLQKLTEEILRKYQSAAKSEPGTNLKQLLDSDKLIDRIKNWF